MIERINEQENQPREVTTVGACPHQLLFELCQSMARINVGKITLVECIGLRW